MIFFYAAKPTTIQPTAPAIATPAGLANGAAAAPLV